MKAFRPRGIYPALVTPFTKEGEELDEAATRNLLRHVLPHVDGVVPGGTTGEFVYLSTEERKRLLEVVIDEVKGRVPVIAGTGAASTRQVIELAGHAQEAGATACLVVTPYYLHPSDKEIYQHFYQIAKAVDLPLILYNIPQTVDAYLPRRVIEDLADIDNIVALKDSSGDLPYMMEVIEMTQGRLDILVGHDEVVLPALAVGCAGMILASAQVFPQIWREIYRRVGEGDLEGARQLQRQIQKLCRIFCRHGGGVAIKEALNMMGVKVGRARRPLKVGGVLMHEVQAEIRLELEKLGMIEGQYPEFVKPSGEVAARFEDLGLSQGSLSGDSVLLGSATWGEGREEAQIDLVMGPKEGPVGEAYARQLTHPRHGYEALTTIAEPNLAVRPSALIVPAVYLANLRQASMVYGPTQAAVAKAILDNVEKGVIPERALDEEVILLKATIHPQALDRHLLYQNVYRATDEALKGALRRGARVF